MAQLPILERILPLDSLKSGNGVTMVERDGWRQNLKSEKKQYRESARGRPVAGTIAWVHESLSQSLQAEAVRIRLDPDAPIDHMRLASVQAILLEGEYHPAAELVAEAILDELTDTLH